MKMTSNIVQPLLRLPRNVKRTIVLLVDATICIFAVWLAYYLRLGDFVSLWGRPMIAAAISLMIALPIFIKLGLYRAIYRYSGWRSVIVIIAAVGLYGLAYALIITVVSISGVPRTVGLIQPMLVLIFVAGSRGVARFVFGRYFERDDAPVKRVRVLIYGAGDSGRQLLTSLSVSDEMRVVGFVDDNPKLTGSTIDRYHIYDSGAIADLIDEKRVELVLLAMPEATRAERNAILERLREAQVKVRTLPNVADLATGKITVADLRPLSIEDLLGRAPVEPDFELMRQTITGRSVLVTGAGGSIGAELCRQTCQLEPKRLVLIEQSEFALYTVHQELIEPCARHGVQLIPLLGSVRDEAFMERSLRDWQAETVFHAAAYKHVPLVEQNVVEGIRNNVSGTRAVANAAGRLGVPRVILISTDKAVRPTNFMGASKRLAELVLQALEHQYPDTRYSMVRFGNVLGSSGSVVPHFRAQIQRGGPVTLTHGDITRFFMSIPEAAQLVVQSSAMARGGDVFVLDMGEPVRIRDLAVRMIELSGRTVRDDDTPEGDIEIAVTGLRPGEKLYEELLLGDDPQPTRHPRIMRAQDPGLDWQVLSADLDTLDAALARNDIDAVRALFEALPLKYGPNDPIADLAALAPGLGLEVDQARSTV